jgi:thioredoxin 1
LLPPLKSWERIRNVTTIAPINSLLRPSRRIDIVPDRGGSSHFICAFDDRYETKEIEFLGFRRIFPVRYFKVSSEHVIHITDSNFESEVVKAGKPVLIDFWAEWCGPCKMIAPMLDEIAAEYQGKVTIAKLNIDENPKTPQRFNVRGIPTLILFKNGQVEGQKVGALRKSDLAAFLDGKL